MCLNHSHATIFGMGSFKGFVIGLMFCATVAAQKRAKDSEPPGVSSPPVHSKGTLELDEGCLPRRDAGRERQDW